MTFKQRFQVGEGTICTSRGRDAKMWSDSGYILRVGPMDFVDESDV